MIVKTFRAPTMNEALAKVKATVGDSALIIDTRRVHTGGFLGLLRRQLVEVVVGIEDEAIAAPCPPPHAWGREMADLRSIERDIEAIKDALQHRVGAAADASEPAAELVARLVERGVGEPAARAVAEECEGGGGDPEERLRAAVARRFRTAEPQRSEHGPRLVALLGPPGVGKTTTLAKLAGRFTLAGDWVTLTSVDFFRVGAVEQLKAYAEILGAPFHPIAEPADALKVVEAAAASQWLLVDTPGLSHHDAERLGQLGGYLKALPGLERHLLLDAASERDAALAAVAAYRSVGFHRIGFTKLDEAHRRGLLLAAAEAADVPVAWLANGQDAATDLDVATPERLADLVLG